jgi:hypothetical protein
MSTYKALLEQSTKDQDQQNITFQVEEGSLQLQADLLSTRRSLVTAKQQLLRTKSAVPFNSDAIADAVAIVTGIENGVELLEALQAELFPV